MLRMLLIVVLALPFCSLTSLAQADEISPIPTDERKPTSNNESLGKDTLLWIAVAEGSAAFMSKLAANHPRAYGNTFIFASPLFSAMSGPKSKTEFLIGTAFFAGMGAYNLSIEGKGESAIFRDNMILYNAIFLPAIAYVIYDKLHIKHEHTTLIVPTLEPNGAMVFVSRNF